MKTTWIRRLLLLLAVVLQVGILSAQENHSAATATVADIGKVVCTDGSIYATVSEAEAEGKTPAAMIAYIDTENETGLAIALSDVYDYSNQKGSFQWAEAADAVASWVDYNGYSVTLDNATWKVPTIQEWQQMLIGCGAEGEVSDYPSSTLTYEGINEKLTAAQEYSALYSSYWSADESDWSSDYAQVVGFSDYDGNIYAQFSNGAKESQWGFSIRASLTFTIDRSVSPGPVGPANITTADIGKVMCTDGSVYATVEDAENDGKTAAAMIAYIDTEGGTGLAIALSDETDNYGDNTMNREDAIAAAARHTPKIAGATWKLPTSDEWKQMLIGCGAEGDLDYYQLSYYELFAKLSEAQGYPLIVSSESNYYTGYWSSDTPDEYDGNLYARYAEFKSEGYVDFSYSTGIYNPNYVRACLAFTIGSVPVEPVNITVTTDDIGKVLCADGSVYATVSDAETDGKTAVAMVAYVDTEHKTGLAIALSDDAIWYGYDTVDWNTAVDVAAAHTPVTGHTWKVPSVDEWKQMLIGCGAEELWADYDYQLSYSSLFNMLNAAGGNLLYEADYWSSTVDDGFAQTATFQSSGYVTFRYATNIYSDEVYARACLAFTIGSGNGGSGDVNQEGELTIVTVTTAGTLEETITSNISNPKSITELKVVGPLNGTDIAFLRRMCMDQWAAEYYPYKDAWPELDDGQIVDPDDRPTGYGNDSGESIANIKSKMEARRKAAMEHIPRQKDPEEEWYQLCNLDLSDATIVAGGKPYYGYSNWECWDYKDSGSYDGIELVDGYFIPFYTEDNVIGRYMFSELPLLQTLILPASATTIGIGAVSDNWQLTSLTLPVALERIESRGLAYLQELNEPMVIPSTVEYIGDYAFSYSNVNVVLGGNITHIGYGAFDGNGNTSELYIPQQLTDIPLGAFAGMQVLETVHFCDGQNSIGDYAFENCYSIIAVDLPETLTSIGRWAFRNCGSMATVNIPASVTEIGEEAFAECSSLESVALPPYLTAISSGLFSQCSSLTTITMGDNVSVIGTAPFSGTALETIRLSGALVEISDSMFYGCEYLQSVEMGSGVRRIGNGAFQNCSALSDFDLPATVTEIGDEAFSECTSLTAMNLSGVTKFGEYIFDGCTALKYVTFSADLDTIPAGLLTGCGIEEIEIPEGVLAIGSNAFYGCESLTSVDIPSTLNFIGDRVFFNCPELVTVNLGTGLTHIGSEAFSYCKKIQSLQLPDGLKTIADRAFYNCTGLESMPIPNSVDSIGAYAFYNCSSLADISIPTSLRKWGNTSFYATGITSAIIPDEIEEIPYGAFSNCRQLTEVHLPANLKRIGGEAFEETAIAELDIPGGVELTDTWIFGRMTSLQTVTLGEGITSIPAACFNGCSNLENVTLPSTLKRIGSNAFTNNAALETLVLPAGLESIGESAFSSSGLKSVVWPESADSIKKETFYNCKQLESITLTGVTMIGPNAFYGCSALQGVVIPNTVTSIGNNVFYNCTALESATLSNQLMSIPYKAFYNCQSLQNIVIPESVDSICEYAFALCNSLGNVAMPQTMTHLGEGAFSACSSLTMMELPEGIELIPYNAFANCSELIYLTLPSTTRTCNYYFMTGTSKLTELYCFAVNPPASTSTSYKYFNGHSGKGFTVYVPAGSEEAYSATSTAWSTYTISGYSTDFSALPQNEWQVLKTIYDNADETVMGNRWNLGTGPETTEKLVGVTLTDGHVTAVNLASCNLTQNPLPTLLTLPQISSINISGNNLTGDLTDMLTETNTSLQTLNIANNMFSGNIGTFASKLSGLTSINASHNCISEINPVFGSNVTTHNVYAQTIEIGMTFREFADSMGYHRNIMPTILAYEETKNSLSTGTPYFRFRNQESGGNWYVELKKVDWQPFSVSSANSSTGIYRGESGVEIEGWGITYQQTGSYLSLPNESNWHRFKIVFDFPQGDIDYSGGLNLSDVQKGIVVALDQYSSIPGYNLTAGDLMQDNEINVLDIVRTVNLLLDQETPNPSPLPRRVMAENGEEEEVTPDVWMYISNGKLLLQSAKEVGALDITVNSDKLQGTRWMPTAPSFSATTRTRNGNTRAVIYSMSGDKLSEGVVEIADFTNSNVDVNSINVGNIMVVDKEGSQLNVKFGRPEATSIDALREQGIYFSVSAEGISVSGLAPMNNVSWTVYTLGGATVSNGTGVVQSGGTLSIPCTLPSQGQVIVKLSADNVNIINKVNIK